jgi:outer membrane protein assembly factor BamB
MSPKKPVRWWPAVVILACAAAVVATIWLLPNGPRQQRYLRTAGALLCSGFLLLAWFLFLSRCSLRFRLGLTGALVILIGAFCATFHIRGVNGDLLPILETRWHAKQQFASGQTPQAPLPARTHTNGLGEFTQFYGPNRNAALAGPSLDTNWVAESPRILWKHPIGAGWSGFAVRDGFAITLEQRDENECTVCYDALSGAQIWSHEDRTHYGTIIAGEGPRSTPTIVTNRVYTFGATGLLNCLDLASGKLIWSRDAAKDNGRQVPDWGFACSPLVVDGKVIVRLGSGSQGSDNALRAYSTETGEPVWAEGKTGPDYSSPVLGNLLGQEQILVFTPGGITSHDLDGKPLWDYPWRGGHPHITPPLIVSSNSFVASTGYGTGAELVRVERTGTGEWKASRVWKSLALKSKFGPLFHFGDSLYGLDDGIFTCLELKSGQRKWKDGRFGHGQGLLVGDLILLTSEKGELVLIEPDPEKLIELARFQVFNDKTWNPPALAGNYLFIRNDKEAACVQLKAKKRA